MMKPAAVALCVLATSASSQTVSGNSLAAACSKLDSQVSVEAGYCVGYITGTWEGIKLGVLHTLLISGAQGPAVELDDRVNQILGICMPDNVEAGQLVDVVRLSLKDKPATRHFPARTLLNEAFREAFPCT